MLLAVLACSTDLPCAQGYGRADGLCVAISDGQSTVDGELESATSAQDTDDEVHQPTEDAHEVDGDLGLWLERSEHMPTAITASWLAPDGAVSWLEVEGFEGRLGEGRDELVLLAPESTDLTVRVVAELDGQRVESAPVTLATGRFDEVLEVPVETVDDGASMSEELVLFTYESDDARRVVLATGGGAVLWQLDDAGLGDSAPVSAQAALDGSGVLVGLWAGHAPVLTTERMQDNAIWRFGWDGAPELELPTPMGHHLFSQPAPGLVAWTGLNPVLQEGDTLPVAFERLVVSALEGADVTVWHSSTLGHQGSCHEGSYYQDACDVHHANSMDCDVETGTCLYSLHNLESVLEVSASGAEVDFATWPVVDLAGDALVGFSRAHDIHWADDGSILVFNDGNSGAWAARYSVDRQTETLTELWSYGRSDCIQSDALGTVQELPSGHHLVGFSSPNNLVREVTPEGQVVWELDLGGLQDGERCDVEGLTAVLGEARMVPRDGLGAGVVALF